MIGVWRSLVSRLVRVQEASGSNPDTPTKKKRQFSKEDCRFFLFFSLFSFRSSLFSKIVVSGEKIREKKEEKGSFASQSIDLNNELLYNTFRGDDE